MPRSRKSAPVVEDLELDEFDLDEVEEDDEEETEAKPKRKKAVKAESNGIGAKEVADRLDIAPKAFRAWLRNQVAAGKIELPDHEAKQRYGFGEDWNDPLIQHIIETYGTWKEQSAERRAKNVENLKKGREKAAANREAAKAAGGTKTKTKVKRAKPIVEEDEDDLFEDDDS